MKRFAIMTIDTDSDRQKCNFIPITKCVQATGSGRGMQELIKKKYQGERAGQGRPKASKQIDSFSFAPCRSDSAHKDTFTSLSSLHPDRPIIPCVMFRFTLLVLNPDSYVPRFIVILRKFQNTKLVCLFRLLIRRTQQFLVI